MDGLSVLFKGVDEISTLFQQMYSAGQQAISMFKETESVGEVSLKSIAEQSELAEKSLSDMVNATEELEDNTNIIDGLSDKFGDLGGKSSLLEKELENLRKENNKLAEEMENLRLEYNKHIDEYKKYREEQEKTKEGFKDLADLLAAIGITYLLKNIADAFLECSDAAATFETSMAQVTTIADNSIITYSNLNSQIKSLSKDTADGVDELAIASYNAISAGIDTANSVETVADATKLAKAGFSETSSTLSLLTTVTNSYNMSADDMTQISDSLVTAQNLGVLTIDQLASSMGKGISAASAYNVGLYNLESGYISLTKSGISVDESTTYLSAMFGELGSTGSNVSNILINETGYSFGMLMEQGYSLADVLEILYDNVENDSEALMNLWSSAEAGKASNAIINQGLDTFNDNLTSLESNIGATESAYAIMTDTTEYSNERMQNSFANLQIALGEDVNPIVKDFQNGIADIADGISSYVDQNPEFTASLVGGSTAIFTLTAGLTAYTVGVKAVVIAEKAWIAVKAMNPLYLAATAVTTLTVGLIAYGAVMSGNIEETEELTYSTRQQAEELESLKKQYDDVVNALGATDTKALELAYQIENLDEKYKQNYQSLDEFNSLIEATDKAHKEMVESHKEENQALETEAASLAFLVDRLDSLANQTDLTASEQQEMLALIDKLNNEVPGLALSYDDLTSSMSMTVEAIMARAKAEADSKIFEQKNDDLIDYLADQATQESILTKLIEEKSAAQEYLNNLYTDGRYDDYTESIQSAYSRLDATEAVNKYKDFLKEIAQTESAISELDSQIAETSTTMEENETEISNLCDELAELTDISDDATTSQEAVAIAVDSISDELTALASSYDEAYTAAYNSINSQIGLFDTMATESEQSVSDMQSAFESQIAYLELYADNLEKASEYGLNESLVLSLSDGSAESAGQLNEIINKIDELGGTTEEAKNFISEFNASFEDVEKAKETLSNAFVNIQTEFEKSMDDITTEMQETITELNMSDEASTAAIATMDAYILGIKSKISEVNSTISAVSLIGNANIELGGYATGTSSAESGLALVGEEGPELIDFSGGEKVYTATETASMISNDNSNFRVSPPETDTDYSSQDKVITLKIEGAGEMKVGTNSGVSKESVVSILVDNVKGVLMNILNQEILEEGDLSYDY